MQSRERLLLVFKVSGPIGLVTIEALFKLEEFTRIISGGYFLDFPPEKKRKNWELIFTINAKRRRCKKASGRRTKTQGRGVRRWFLKQAGKCFSTSQLNCRRFTKKGGRVVLIGSPLSKLILIFELFKKWVDKELRMFLGVFPFMLNVLPLVVLDLLKCGKVDLQSLIHPSFFPLEKNSGKLLQFAHEHKEESIKVVVNL